MRFIGMKEAGTDKAIKIPVWMINDAELRLLMGMLVKADTYYPEAFTPDRSRLRNMKNQIGDYLRERTPKVKFDNTGMEKQLVSEKVDDGLPK